MHFKHQLRTLYMYTQSINSSVLVGCSEILLVRNVILDWFSYAFFIWNFGCMGLMVIHWKGPLRLQQAYLILTSALVVSSCTAIYTCMVHVLAHRFRHYNNIFLREQLHLYNAVGICSLLSS